MMQQSLFLLLWGWSISSGWALGGEKAFFTTPQMTPDTRNRQNICDRYERFRSRMVKIEDALAGMRLNVILQSYDGAYFHYDDDTGIDPNHPGLVATVLDELARRAQFTWRDSFGIGLDPTVRNSTWDELLRWGTESYDLSVDQWAITVSRMKNGVAYLHGSLDTSPILIGKQKPREDDSGVELWAWLKPYNLDVWLMTLFTIFISGIVYQILEWHAGVREERSLWEWWLENLYLSAINFTQAYEYQPKTLASRMFGVSMAIWALVMTATYTANLASLLVDRSPPPQGPQTLAEAVFWGHSICVFTRSFSDDYMRDHFENANVIRKTLVLDLFQALNNGECDYAIVRQSGWHKAKVVKALNPNCDLYWVGGDRKIFTSTAAFATKADSGNLCTSFIREVLDIHLREMEASGFLAAAFEQDFLQAQDIDCNAYKPGVSLPSMTQSATQNPDADRRRLLMSSSRHQQNKNVRSSQEKLHRKLKGGGKGAVGGAVALTGGTSEDKRRLSADDMIGTFVFHWASMVIALLVASINALYVKYAKGHPSDRAAVPLSNSDTAAGEQQQQKMIAQPEESHRTTAGEQQQQKMIAQLEELHRKVDMLSIASQNQPQQASLS